MTGPDYQILDGHGKTGYANEIAKGNLSGAFYDFLPSKVEWCKPAAEWNEESIKVQGTKVTLTVNGHLSARRHRLVPQHAPGRAGDARIAADRHFDPVTQNTYPHANTAAHSSRETEAARAPRSGARPPPGSKWHRRP